MSVVETEAISPCVVPQPALGPRYRRLYLREGGGFIEATPEDVYEIARELIAEHFHPRALVLSDPALVELFFRLHLGPRDRQVFAAVYLNARRRFLGYVELSLGTVNQVEIHPREALREGLLRNATDVIFGRNSVCGTSEPNLDDERAFHRLRVALETVGIRALDYLVIGETTTSLSATLGQARPARTHRLEKRTRRPSRRTCPSTDRTR